MNAVTSIWGLKKLGNYPFLQFLSNSFCKTPALQGSKFVKFVKEPQNERVWNFSFSPEKRRVNL